MLPDPPCKNGANCSNTDGGYTCNCTEFWMGKDCNKGTLNFMHQIELSVITGNSLVTADTCDKFLSGIMVIFLSFQGGFQKCLCS